LFDIQKKSHQELLFTKILKLDPLNKEGKTSVNDEFQKVYKDVPEVKLLTQWNKLGKLKSSYIDSIMHFMTKENKEADFFTDLRVRAQYMFDAVTGRLKSARPNQQQRPSHGDNIDFVLSLYEASNNKMLVKLDQSTFEVRGMGFISRDKSLCKSFIEMHDLKTKWRNDPSIMSKDELKNLTDTHKRNASVFFGTPIAEVTPEMRQDTKSFVFGVSYGMGDNSIAASLGKTLKQAQEIKKLFLKNMPGAAKWLFEWIINFAKKNLYVESPLGRRRRLWGHLLPKGAATSKMDRLAMNAPIQGMCSDLNIIATSLLIGYIYKWGIGKYQVPDEEAFMVINLVHDSCEMEVYFYLFHNIF
jgi:DNA polymerase-1